MRSFLSHPDISILTLYKKGVQKWTQILWKKTGSLILTNWILICSNSLMSSIIRTVLKPYRRRSERDVLVLEYKSIITLDILLILIVVMSWILCSFTLKFDSWSTRSTSYLLVDWMTSFICFPCGKVPLIYAQFEARQASCIHTIENLVAVPVWYKY